MPPLAGTSTLSVVGSAQVSTLELWARLAVMSPGLVDASSILRLVEHVLQEQEPGGPGVGGYAESTASGVMYGLVALKPDNMWLQLDPERVMSVGIRALEHSGAAPRCLPACLALGIAMAACCAMPVAVPPALLGVRPLCTSLVRCLTGAVAACPLPSGVAVSACMSWSGGCMPVMERWMHACHGAEAACLSWSGGCMPVMEQRLHACHGAEAACLSWSGGCMPVMERWLHACHERQLHACHAAEAACLSWSGGCMPVMERWLRAFHAAAASTLCGLHCHRRLKGPARRHCCRAGWQL
jgi:hypothetical protein